MMEDWSSVADYDESGFLVQHSVWCKQHGSNQASTNGPGFCSNSGVQALAHLPTEHHLSTTDPDPLFKTNVCFKAPVVSNWLLEGVLETQTGPHSPRSQWSTVWEEISTR